MVLCELMEKGKKIIWPHLYLNVCRMRDTLVTCTNFEFVRIIATAYVTIFN